MAVDFERPLMLTKATVMQIQTLWLILDKTGDGKISDEAFLALAGGQGETDQQQAMAKWQVMSRHFDADHSGDITPFEFIDGFKEKAMGEALDWEGIESMPEQTYLDMRAKINESVNRQLQNLVKNVHAYSVQDFVPPSAAGKRLAGMVRVRGGGCAESKPRAQAEPFIQDLNGPPSSPSLAVEQGAEAAAEDVKAAEPVPETTDSAVRTEPAAGAATEAESAPAEASAETRNQIVEIGNSIFEAIVLAFSPRGTSVLPNTALPNTAPKTIEPNTAPKTIELDPIWTTEGLEHASTRLADQLSINTENQVQIEEIFNHLDQTKDGVLIRKDGVLTRKDGVLTWKDFGPTTSGEVSLRDGSGSLPFGRRPPPTAPRPPPAARSIRRPARLRAASGAASSSDKAPPSFAWCTAGAA